MNEGIKKDDKVEVVIVDMGHGGEGIGKANGMTVFVDGAVVGDRVKVKMTKVKKNYAIGKIIKLIEPSSDRVKPLCEYTRSCGGCQIQEMDYQKQLDMKTNMVRSNIERIGKIKDPVIYDTLGMQSPYHYRNKAQFPIGWGKEAVIGFYRKKSHDLIDIDSCVLQDPITDTILKEVKQYMNTYNIPSYNEKTGEGILRHLLIKVGFTTKEIMVVLVTNKKKLLHYEVLIESLTQKVPNIKSIVQNINHKKSNVILGQECMTLYGKDHIKDYIGDLTFNISPLSFFQVNPMQTKVLYDKALEYAQIQKDEIVMDLYCGIGTISLFVARYAKKVYGIEIVDRAIEDAKENAKINHIDNVEFLAGKVETIIPKLYEEGMRADVVIVDPPRKGCDEKVLETICKINPKRIVYVSCNPSTLARDLHILEEKGYATQKIQPVDMFPHTSHVETVVKIVRK